MMRKILLGLVAVTMALPAAAADAKRYDRYYDREGNYNGPTWRDNDGRLHCRRPDGTTGLIIGGAAGALAGRAIDTRGERTTGTVVGAVAGALIGREIERSQNRCR